MDTKDNIITFASDNTNAVNKTFLKSASNYSTPSPTTRPMDLIPKTWAVIPFTFFQMVSLSTNFYILPQLVLAKVCKRTFNYTVCGRLGHSNFKAQENYVYAKAAEWNALLNFAGFFPATILILPLGAMTDLVSKQKMLLLPAIFNIVSCLISLLSSIFIELHLGFLVLANFAISIFGEIHGCITLCCSYAASASKDNKTIALSIVFAVVQISLGIGGFVTNFLKRYYGFPCVFGFTAIVLVVSLLYALLLIPPTDDFNELSSQKEQYDFWYDFKEHAKGTWYHLVSFIMRRIFYSKDKTFLLLLIAAFLNLASYGGERALLALFLKHSPLDFTADKIGNFFVLFQFAQGLGLILLLLLGNRLFHPSDYSLMFIGTTAMIANYIMTSLSTTALMAYLSTILALPASFTAAAVRSQLIKLVPSEEHGVSLSLVGLMDVFGELIMAVVANGFFIATAKVYSGFSILLLSAINFMALIILCIVYLTSDQAGNTNSHYHRLSSNKY